MKVCKECKSCSWYNPGGAEGCWGEEIPCRSLSTKEKSIEDKHTRTWQIWGNRLPALIIKASSLDDALVEARKVDPMYNAGRVLGIIKEG